MTSDELDSAEREAERGAPDHYLIPALRRVSRHPEQARDTASRRLFSADGDSIHLPLGQRMRKPESAEGDDDV
jgi:hypothetical protein